MIADKTFPSFFVIELEGAAIHTILPGDFGIEKVALGSITFPHDLTAIDMLHKTMNNLKSSIQLKDWETKETISYNPEFFPSLAPLLLTTDEIMEQELEAAEINEHWQNTDNINIIITKNFDELGDFIQVRWVLESKGFNVCARVAINPEEYAKQKGAEMISKLTTISTKPTNILLH